MHAVSQPLTLAPSPSVFQKELTLLMCGARNSRLSVVNLILESLEEPDLEAADSEQQTALYHAALAGHADVVETLLQAGADANTKNKVITHAPSHPAPPQRPTEPPFLMSGPTWPARAFARRPSSSRPRILFSSVAGGKWEDLRGERC